MRGQQQDWQVLRSTFISAGNQWNEHIYNFRIRNIFMVLGFLENTSPGQLEFLANITQNINHFTFTVSSTHALFQEVVGAENGQIPFNATFKEDLNHDRDLDRSGKCVVLKSMPINETEIENISRLEPFCDLLDFCDRYVRPANPEMIPEMDLSQEAYDEYYEMENLMYQEERIEWEKERLQFQHV